MKSIITTIGSLIMIIGSVNLQSQSTGEPAPDFSVGLQGGGTYTLSANAGKVHLLFFFGNTCPNCISAGPSVQDLYEQFMDEAQFTAIGLDTWNSSSSESSVTGFRNQTGITFPLALEANSVATAYSTTYDRLLVIDQEGIIRFKGTSAAANDISSASTVIGNLLASEPTSIAGATGNTPSVAVYPLPASDRLIISAETEDFLNHNLMVFTAAGKAISIEQEITGAGSRQIQLDVSAFAEGVYIFKLELNGKSTSGKFLVQR